MTTIDADLGEVHALLLGYGRCNPNGLAAWTTIDIQIAGRGQQVNADSHILTMTLARGREVEMLSSLLQQVTAALDQTLKDIRAEIDARLGKLSMDKIEDDSPLTEPLS